MTEKLTFGYWGTRGLGQVSRLLLAYTGAVWEDVKYTSREQWFEKDREGLGLTFPNLPYLIDGDFKLTESNAINQYIATRSGHKQLLGKSIQDQARVESLLGVFFDFRKTVGVLIYDKEWESKVSGVLEKAEGKLEQLNNFYGEKDFALGYLTLVDFQIAEFGHYLEKISPQTFAKYPFLGRTRTAFNNLPEIKKYYESETAVKGPFTSQQAAIIF